MNATKTVETLQFEKMRHIDAVAAWLGAGYSWHYVADAVTCEYLKDQTDERREMALDERAGWSHRREFARINNCSVDMAPRERAHYFPS